MGTQLEFWEQKIGVLRRTSSRIIFSCECPAFLDGKGRKFNPTPTHEWSCFALENEAVLCWDRYSWSVEDEPLVNLLHLCRVGKQF